MASASTAPSRNASRLVRAGWRNRKGTIPARPFLGVSETDEVEVLEIVERHLLGALEG